MKNLSTALVAREEALAEALRELEVARAENANLDNEKANLARTMECEKKVWQQENRELCVQLVKEQSAQKELASKLANATKEIGGLSNDMIALCGKYDVLEQQLTQQTLISQSLEKELAQALESSTRAEQRNRSLEDQLNVQESL